MKKIDKKTLIILIATVVLALIAVATAWRFYDLRRQAVSPTAPKLVPAQEPSSSCTVSFTIGGTAGICPVNPVCCLEPLTTCTNTLQCGAGNICYFGYCVKQTYDSAANTCPGALPRIQPVGSGGEDGGGGAGGTGGTTTPAVSPRPSPSPSPSSAASPSPSPRVSPSPSAGTSPSPGSSSTSPSSSPTSQAGSSTSAPSGTAKTAQAKLPQAGTNLPTIAIGAGGILILIFGILLAF